MPRSRISKVSVLCCATIAGTSVALAGQTCLYDGASFSIGATICECPQLTSNGSEYLVLQRRLACTDNGGWQAVSDQTYKHCLALGFDTSDDATRLLLEARADSCLHAQDATAQDANN